MSPVPAKCRACGRRVVWAVDEAGKRQCLDPVPPIYLANESRERCERRKTDPLRIPILGDAAGLAVDVEGAFMVSHFATCSGVDKVKARQAEKARS